MRARIEYWVILVVVVVVVGLLTFIVSSKRFVAIVLAANLIFFRLEHILLIHGIIKAKWMLILHTLEGVVVMFF